MSGKVFEYEIVEIKKYKLVCHYTHFKDGKIEQGQHEVGEFDKLSNAEFVLDSYIITSGSQKRDDIIVRAR